MLAEISEASATSSGAMKAASSMVLARFPSVSSKEAVAIETTASMKEPQATDT